VVNKEEESVQLHNTDGVMKVDLLIKGVGAADIMEVAQVRRPDSEGRLLLDESGGIIDHSQGAQPSQAELLLNVMEDGLLVTDVGVLKLKMDVIFVKRLLTRILRRSVCVCRRWAVSRRSVECQ